MNKDITELDWAEIRNILAVAGEKSNLMYIIDDCITTNKNMSTLDLAEEIAWTILKSGYTYLKWHKVKDNDFPDNDRDILVYYRDSLTGEYKCELAYYNSSSTSFVSRNIDYTYISSVIAWIDKPQYFEYEGIKL